MIDVATPPVQTIARKSGRERSGPGFLEYSEVSAVFRVQQGQYTTWHPETAGRTRFAVEHGLSAPPNDVYIMKTTSSYGISQDAFDPSAPLVKLTDDRLVVRGGNDLAQPETRYRSTWAASGVHLETSDLVSDGTYSYFTIGLSCYPWSTVFRIDDPIGGMLITLPPYVGNVLAMHVNWMVVGAFPVGQLRIQPEGGNPLGFFTAVPGGLIFGPVLSSSGLSRSILIQGTSASDAGKFGIFEALCGPQPESFIGVKVRSQLNLNPNISDRRLITGTRAHPAP